MHLFGAYARWYALIRGEVCFATRQDAWAHRAENAADGGKGPAFTDGNPVLHRFGPFVLAGDRLTAAGQTVHLPAKPLAVLRALLERPGDTFDKYRISLAAWG